MPADSPLQSYHFFGELAAPPTPRVSGELPQDRDACDEQPFIANKPQVVLLSHHTEYSSLPIEDAERLLMP